MAQKTHNWQYFNLDEMIKEELDITVSPNAKTFEDLCIQPISFPQGVERYLWQYKAKYHRSKEELER